MKPMTELQQRVMRYRTNATVGQLRELIACIAMYVMREYPNAVALVSTNDYGRPAYIGIYNCKVRLNSLHNWDYTNQHAPQLMGERIRYCPEVSDDKILLLSRMDAWVSCLQWLARVDPCFTDKIGLTVADY